MCAPFDTMCTEDASRVSSRFHRLHAGNHHRAEIHGAYTCWKNDLAAFLQGAPLASK
jgi:hypothetical protein